MDQVHTAIFSDWHIRSKNCQAERILATLQALWRQGVRKVILNGDSMEDFPAFWYGTAIDPCQMKILQCLRSMMDYGIEVIRIRGNHDAGSDYMSETLGIKKSLKGYRWEVAGKIYCAIHGDRFDLVVSRNPMLSWMISQVLLLAQRIDTRTRWLTRMLDHYHTEWFRLTEKVAEGAVKFARKKSINADVIFCGHTHAAIHLPYTVKGKLIHYWNSGGWTGHVCSFIGINPGGEVALCLSHEDGPVWQVQQVRGSTQELSQTR